MTKTIVAPDIIARLRVRGRFLLPRLNADELGLHDDNLLGTSQKPLVAVQAALAGEEREPVCGMRLGSDDIGHEYGRHLYHFCSASCREQFRQTPEYSPRAVSRR